MSEAILAESLPKGIKSTKIAWTDTTLNFWIGCQKISPGCKNCYAERIVRDRMGREHWATSPRWRTKAAWDDAYRYNRIAKNAGRRIMVFANDMSDWAEDHPDVNRWRWDMWRVIKECRWLDWQLLTKRADRIARCLPADWNDGYPNVWLGVSIESDDYCWRADRLREVNSGIRFISYEPALGPLDSLDLAGIDWLIIGGESGPHYRPFDHNWARELRVRCALSNTAFFFKQSAAIRTEMGIELDGAIVREYPKVMSDLVGVG